MDMNTIIMEDFTKAGAFILLYAFILLIAKWAKDFLTPYKLNSELGKKDNLAVAMTMSGYYLGVTAIFAGTLMGPSQGLVTDITLVTKYSILGLAFLNIARFLNDKIILRKFCDTQHLTTEQNTGVGAVHFGVYLATGLIAAGAVSGQGGGIASAAIFFILGQASLCLFSLIYQLLTPGNIHEQLEKKNIASGVGFGGTLIALGIIILNGTSGNFTDWQSDLTLFTVTNVAAFIFLPVIRLIMDKLVIPGHSLNKEIMDEQNVGAGLLEATTAIGFAIVLTIMI